MGGAQRRRHVGEGPRDSREGQKEATKAMLEILESNNGSINLPHLGTMGELSYSFSGENLGPIQSIAPKVRYDYLDKSAFVALNSDTYQNFSFGLNFQIHDSYILSLDYNVFGENNTPLNNNRFVARMSAKF